jgi:hypothetical protein
MTFSWYALEITGRAVRRETRGIIERAERVGNMMDVEVRPWEKPFETGGEY